MRSKSKQTKNASHFGDINSREFILLVNGLNSFIVFRILIIAIVLGHIFMPVQSLAEGLSATGNQHSRAAEGKIYLCQLGFFV